MIISDLLLFLGSHFISATKTVPKKWKPLLSSIFEPTSGKLWSISVQQLKHFNLTILTFLYETKSFSVKFCEVQFLELSLVLYTRQKYIHLVF